MFLHSQGLGTTDSVLIRIMVARAEIDMLDIKAEFLKMYGKTLHSFIKVGHWGHLTKHNLQKPLTKHYNYFKTIHLFSRVTHRAITVRSCWSCAEGKSNTSGAFISVKRSLSHQPSAFQTHSLFVIPIKTKQWCFKWDLWFFFFVCLFIALGFMGVLYRLAHLRVCQINKRKEQPTLTVLIFCCLAGYFFNLGSFIEVHLFNYSEYNLFNVQHQCIPSPIILIAHGCLHRHMKSHMRLYFCVFLDCFKILDVPQFNQVQHMKHMRFGTIIEKMTD